MRDMHCFVARYPYMPPRAVWTYHIITLCLITAGRPWGWLAQLAGRLKIQHPVRFVLNFVALMALMRFWPISGQRHPLGVSEPITVQVGLGLPSGLLPDWARGVEELKARACVLLIQLIRLLRQLLLDGICREVF